MVLAYEKVPICLTLGGVNEEKYTFCKKKGLFVLWYQKNTIPLHRN